MKLRLRRRTKNTITVIGAIIAVVLVCTIDFNDIAEPTVIQHDDETPAWMMDGAEISHFEEAGKLDVVIEAKQLQFYNSDKRLELSYPSVKQGEATSLDWQIAWHATSEKGTSYSIGKELNLSGSVNVYNLLHYYQLSSDTLDIDGDLGTLSSNSEVTVVGPDISLSSHGVNANWFEQSLELNKDVRVQIETR